MGVIFFSVSARTAFSPSRRFRLSTLCDLTNPARQHAACTTTSRAVCRSNASSTVTCECEGKFKSPSFVDRCKLTRKRPIEKEHVLLPEPRPERDGDGIARQLADLETSERGTADPRPRPRRRRQRVLVAAPTVGRQTRQQLQHLCHGLSIPRLHIRCVICTEFFFFV